MPAGILPNEGIGFTLSELLGRVAIPVLPWKLILWTNNYTPTATTTLANLTEATFGGYARANLDRDLWEAPVVGAGCAHSDWSPDTIDYTVTGGPFETIYGCAYLDVANGVLRFVQRFDTADIFTLELGSVYKVPVQFTLTSGEC